MAQTSEAAIAKPKASEQIARANNTIALPYWFMIVVYVLFAFRVYTKLTQMEAPAGKGVAWISLEQYQKMGNNDSKPKDLVLYEFTAEWCPPCKKRERTTFRAPEVIRRINDTFIPVRVDLTDRDAMDKADIKQLCEKFNVQTIPRCVITLRSGEFVKEDRYLFDDLFDTFLTNAIQSAATVHAELDLSHGDNAAALARLSPETIKGHALSGAYQASEYVMCHHLLMVLNRQADAEAMLKHSLELTEAQRQGSLTDENTVKWLEQLNNYLLGKVSERDTLAQAQSDSEKAVIYLAVGLKHLRDGDKVQALKTLHQASLFNAKSYNSDSLAEFLTKTLE